MNDPNPPVRLIEVSTDRGVIHVADDSILPGGTKQRAAIPFINELQQQVGNRFSYASPSTGFAQVALARSCEALGAECVIYAAAMDGQMSPFTESIVDVADVVLCESLEEAEDRASRDATAYKIPLGFDHKRYNYLLRHTLLSQWSHIKTQFNPKRLWLPLGSGTLYRAFKSCPIDCEIITVDVRVLPPGDPRIAGATFQAAELFRDPAEIAPPFQANAWYEAKGFRYWLEHGSSNDLFWVVAR